jgi:ABC-type glycerol-3-phosphate transport system substrate-binding protein
MIRNTHPEKEIHMKKKIALTLALLALALAGCVMPSGSHTLSTPGASSYGASAAPAEEETTTRAALPTASEFRLQVIETSRQCFGDAGCNVTYRVVPTWVGSGTAPESSFTLLYQVTGMSDGAKTGNIAVTDGKFATETGFGSAEDGTTLTARVTQVLED